MWLLPAALDLVAFMAIWTGLSGWSSRVPGRGPAKDPERTLRRHGGRPEAPTKTRRPAHANDNTSSSLSGPVSRGFEGSPNRVRALGVSACSPSRPWQALVLSGLWLFQAPPRRARISTGAVQAVIHSSICETALSWV